MNQPAIFLNEEDSAKFVLFMEHYDLFNLLLDKGVFNIKNGSATIHYNHLGTVTSIDRKDVLYHSKIFK